MPRSFSLKNKKIIVGISGGIAAYKTASLVRELIKAGAQVRVIMTHAAKSFITPLTMQVLSGAEVHEHLIDEKAEAGMGHIELARWADCLIIAPASANIISELAQGSAAHLLTTICLATSAPIFICPAMNKYMWLKPLVQKNIATLFEQGFSFIGPENGEQACGDVGLGRMSEPSAILLKLTDYFLPVKKVLKGCKVLITLGPTREYLDPVRYITNESSGLMGHSLAMSAFHAGAEVTVIAGPNALTFSKDLMLIPVITANDMYEAVDACVRDFDLFIATAAVSDYRPLKVSEEKIKKSEDKLQLSFVKNQDILAHVGLNQLCPFVVGFAAETHDFEAYAKNKLYKKKLDLIVANQVGLQGTGFNSVYNKVSVFDKTGENIHFDTMEKAELATHLIALIANKMKGEKNNEKSTS